MARKKKVDSEAEAQDQEMMEGLDKVRGESDQPEKKLRRQGRKKGLRKAKGVHGEDLRKMG